MCQRSIIVQNSKMEQKSERTTRILCSSNFDFLYAGISTNRLHDGPSVISPLSENLLIVNLFWVRSPLFSLQNINADTQQANPKPTTQISKTPLSRTTSDLHILDDSVQFYLAFSQATGLTNSSSWLIQIPLPKKFSQARSFGTLLR